MSISKKYRDRIKAFSERLGIPEKELVELFLGIKQEFSSLRPDLSEKALERKAYERLRGELRREYGAIYSPAPIWTAILFGCTDVIDFVELMKRKAIALWENPATREEAIENLLVTRDGVPLDPREQVDFQPNPNFGRPFGEDDHSYYRAFFGVCSRGRTLTDDLKFFRLNINGENALEIDYALWQPVQFRGNIRKKNPYPFLDLNAIRSQPVEFRSIDLPQIPDIAECLEFSEWPPRRVAEIPDLWDRYYADKKDQNLPILLEANVLSISREISEKTGNRFLLLDDPDLDFDAPALRCFLPGHLEINFTLDSRVIFVGKVDYIRSGDGGHIFSAWGYYAPEKYLIPG